MPRPLPSAARLAAALLVALAAGCMRSGPLATDGLDCAPGALVVVQASAACVYLQPDLPERCPDALPHRYDRPEGTVCLRQRRPAMGLVDQILGRVMATDGGIRVLDVGAPDARRPTIVDAGGTSAADF